MDLGWCIKGGHKRFPLLWIQLEALPMGQRLGRTGQGAFQHTVGHAALRFATAAARCRVCLAPGVSRRSSFSPRKGVDFKEVPFAATLTPIARQCHDGSGDVMAA